MVKASFIADFTSFDQAVQKASAELKGFEQDANKVGASLTRMANQFSGQKIIQDATLMTKAISEVGGASTLTEKEMARVNATLTAAIEKYRALGGVAPKAMVDLANATKTADIATSSWSSSLTKVNSLLGALGIGLSVGAVVSFGKELLRMGDEIVRVADRTGLTTDEVQKLSYVASQSGNTIDELTQAIGQMQNRLSSGDKSAVASVKELGINFAALNSATPAKQLEMIATAIAKIPDPADRTRIAMDLFGKAGTAILPTLTSQFEQLAAAAPKMSEATVRALDTAGDQLGTFGLQIKVWAAESYLALGRGFDAIIIGAYKAAAALNDSIATMGRLAEKIPGMGKVFSTLGIDFQAAAKNAQWFRDAAAAMAQPVEKAADATNKFVKPLKDVAEHTGKVATNTEKATIAIDAFVGPLQEVLKSTDTWGLGIGQLNQRVPDLTTHIEAQAQAFEDLRAEVEPLASTALPAFNLEVSNFVGPMESATKNVDRLHQVLGPIEEVLGGIQTKFAQLAVVAARTIEGMVKSFGKGDWIGGIVAGVTGGIQLITSLFTNAEKAINKTRKAFVDAAGGLDALRDKATAAGITINALLNAKNAKQYEQAIKDINAALDEHAKDIDRAKALMLEYGITIEETGQKWRDQQLQEQTKGLIDDYRIMVDVLDLSVAGAAEKMAGKFNDFLHTAQKVGFEIPAEMKPILEQMVQLGLLTDEQGNAYEDLEDTGVTFAETFAKSIDRLIDKFDEFLQRLNLVPAQIDTTITTHHEDDWSNSSSAGMHTGGLVMHGGGVVPGKILPFIPTAHNGLGPGERMIRAQTGEAILSRSDVSRLGGAQGFAAFRAALRGGGAGGDLSGVESRLDKLSRELRADRLTAAHKLARAVRDEVQKAGGRR